MSAVLPAQSNGIVEQASVAMALGSWRPEVAKADQDAAAHAIESGKILTLALPFALLQHEKHYLAPQTASGDTKSVKFSLATGRLWGHSGKDEESPPLAAMIRRYAESAQSLVTRLFPRYAPHLIVGNTSFRPVEAEGRVQSKRHDDRLLHIDAFPSRPNGGLRLLRVFTNIHPGGRNRVWRAGEPFRDAAAHFLPKISAPLPGSAALLKLLHITKTRRTPYDHYMLRLHDAMKYDDAYQHKIAFSTLNFTPGTSWIVFSDQVSHAAMSGQHMLEQTFMLPPFAQYDPATSPLFTLEKLVGKKLA